MDQIDKAQKLLAERAQELDDSLRKYIEDNDPHIHGTRTENLLRFVLEMDLEMDAMVHWMITQLAAHDLIIEDQGKEIKALKQKIEILGKDGSP